MSLLAIGVGMIILAGILLAVIIMPMAYEARMTAIGAIIVLSFFAIVALGGV
jgi:hypothetical protein